MTATTSAATKNYFGKRYLTDILENKKVLIINFVLELLGLPLLSIVGLIGMFYDEHLDDTSKYYDITVLLIPFIMIAVGTIIISLLLGFVLALFHFNYLYRKPVVDMHYSLPLSNTQRFFSDYLSGLSIYLVPVLIAIILSFIILGVGSVFIDMKEFWQVVPNIFKAGLIVLVGMVMLYTISVFSIVFCGSTFEAIFSIIATNTMIPATIACVWLAIITTSSYGMVGESIFYSPVFTATSPFGAVIFFFMYISDGIDDIITYGMNSYYNSMYIRWMIVAFIVIAVYLAAAFLLYKLRKAESVSKPYVYKAFFYAISTMAVFCIISLLIASGINIIVAAVAGIIICGIGWFIMEVIARRGFKRFWTAPIGFAAAVCGVFLICGICKVTDGFGAPRHVPAAISVESVSISSYDSNILPHRYNDISFRDKDVIKAVTAFNKDAVDRHFKFDKYSYNSISDIDTDYDRYDSQRVEITYQTIYGSTVKREYTVMSSMLSDVVEAILTSDEYAQLAVEDISLNAANTGNRNKTYRTLSEINRDKTGGKLSVSNKLYQNVQTLSLNHKSLKELTEAYRKDLENMTPEQLREGNVCCYFGSYWVLDSFDNTLSFLADRDVSIPQINGSDLDNSYTTNTNTRLVYKPRFYSTPKEFFGKDDSKRSRYYYYDDGYYNGADMTRFSEIDSITSAFAEGDSHYYYDDEFDDIDYSSDELILLFNAATPIVINEKPIAIIHYGGHTFYIHDTAENRALLRKYYYAD